MLWMCFRFQTSYGGSTTLVLQTNQTNDFFEKPFTIPLPVPPPPRQYRFPGPDLASLSPLVMKFIDYLISFLYQSHLSYLLIK